MFDRDGRYIISGILPGKYSCEVQLSGFATQIQKGLTLAVGARLTIDFKLIQAALDKEIVVTAEAPMVEVTKSEISSVVDRKQIDELPLLDRNFESLTITKAGTQEGGRAVGQPSGSGEMLVDGASNEWVPTNSSRMSIPADAIQEFRVITNQFQAEYGNASGMVRSAITRGGH